MRAPAHIENGLTPPPRLILAFTVGRFSHFRGHIGGFVMRNKPSQIHPASLGGFTIEGPFYRRPSRVARALDRFFHWLGA